MTLEATCLPQLVRYFRLLFEQGNLFVRETVNRRCNLEDLKDLG
jgi:hypothetical protein